MIKAMRIQDKVSHVGFDWDKKEDVWQKVKEEISELEQELRSGKQDKMEEEFGDVLFVLINAARLYGINPETALERTNRKFISRFKYLEQKLKEQGKDITQVSLKEMDELWEQAKHLEKDESD
jgi:XTP/dITP diphosphohydrolase